MKKLGIAILAILVITIVCMLVYANMHYGEVAGNIQATLF